MAREELNSGAEQAVRALERLRFALSAAAIGTWHLDLHTGCATFDESLNTILGLLPADTTESLAACLDRVHPDDRAQVRRAIQTAVAARRALTIEFRIVRPDGGVRWLRGRARIVDDEQGNATAIAGGLADVTEQHEREEIERLERANRVADEFLAALSHEIRTPLNAVLGWTRMLRRGAVPPERAASILQTIEHNAAAQMQLMDDLLDLSIMAGGALRLNITPVDLRDVVDGALDSVRAAADAHSLRLTVTMPDRVPGIAADASRLRQALWHLLANAVKFTPAGGSIEITVNDGPADVEIAVRDSGPGIAGDLLPRVFEPFRQGHTGATRVPGGLGLGLAIVRHIVEAHGGAVTAHNVAGAGALFVMRLPASRAPRGAAAVESGAVLRGRRVLAVDDDESTQELVATMLLMYGVSVRTAGRSSQALQILTEWRPDVLLADIAMPGEDGYALMRRVRALPSPLGAIPAVALTGFTDPESVQQSFGAGFDAHLGKPLEPHVLADALARVLRLRRAL